MEYSLRAMELWFQHLPGSLLLELEKAALSDWFSQISGDHCLQIGGPSGLQLIQAGHYAHKLYLSTQFASAIQNSRVQSSLTELPFVTGSLDAIAVAHMLEFAESPLDFLKETYRILAPEGHLILLSFNPWSQWGITRLKREKRGFPWSGNFYSSSKIKRWLRTAGYSIILSKTLCFRPVLHDMHRCDQLKFMETLGAFCFSGLGAVSLMIAQKQEIGMTPIKISWSRRQVKARGGVIEPTTYR